MSWNYRIVKELTPGPPGETYTVREVVYTGDQGEHAAWASKGEAVSGETLAALRDDVDRQALAWLRPVLIVRGADLVAEVAHDVADAYRPGMRRTP